MSGKRWIIVKGQGADANPARPWQLWLADGTDRTFFAERASQALCVTVMDWVVVTVADLEDA